MFQSQFDALPSSERLQASILANEAELMRLNQKLEQHPHLASELETQILAVRSRIDTETNQLETFDGMTFDSYIQMMLASGNVTHSVDRGLLSVVSDVTDIFGIVSAVGWVTGRNFITGERLTTAEQRAAGFNALISVASLAASMAGAGLAKKAGSSAVRYLAADLASTALGGVSGMATAGLLDYMNAPPWLQTLGGVGVGFGVGMGSNIALTDGLNVRNAGAVSDEWLVRGGIDNRDARFIQGGFVNNSDAHFARTASAFGEMSFEDATRYNRWHEFANSGISVEDRVRLLNWTYPPSANLYLNNIAVYNDPRFFNQVNGNINWPGQHGDPNVNGFLNGQFTVHTLERGMIIDRYGSNPGGQFFSPDGSSFESRALAPHMRTEPFSRYEVLVPFDVEMGTVAPWFHQPGMGTQFFTNIRVTDIDGNVFIANVQNLLDFEYIVEITNSR